MSEPSQSQNLLEGLVGHVAGVTSADGHRSLGVVGPAVSSPQLPTHCLRHCLNGIPDRVESDGCAWLRAMVHGELDGDCLERGRCPRGLRVAGQPVRLNGTAGFLVVVEEIPAAGPAEGSPDPALRALESLSALFEQVDQRLDENEGLADEVLRSYEQLNLIFDFTQQIASFTDVDEIEKVLLGRLGELLAAETMMVVGANGDCRCYDVGSGALMMDGYADIINDQLGAKIEALRRSRTLSVHSTRRARIVLGPLARLDDQVDMVLATRVSDAREFTSGDLLMFESILAFGGQIISNAEIHARLRRMSLESTRALVAAIDKKDHYTCGHSERVGYLARLTGQRMGVPANELQILEMSGLLHDVGKIGVPEEILCKPGRLTPEEYDTIRNHPRMGYEILKPIGSFGTVLDGVLYHHENPDGSGYPEGLSGHEIPLFARIIHVVDVFDALTSTRSYRVAFSFEQACDIVRKESGTKLDADVVNVFLALLPDLSANHPDEFSAVFRTDREVVNVDA